MCERERESQRSEFLWSYERNTRVLDVELVEMKGIGGGHREHDGRIWKVEMHSWGNRCSFGWTSPDGNEKQAAWNKVMINTVWTER